MLRWLIQFVWLYFFIYCVCLFPFAKFFFFFHLCCADVGEIKLYIYLLKSTVQEDAQHDQHEDNKGTENWRLHFAH